MNTGLFITFEGCDGCGKTTVMNLVCQQLIKKGYDILQTREPGGSTIAEEIRNIILDKKNILMDSRTEALLYAASRRQHLVEVVLPALKENKIVICDRYLDSSLAYQGYAREIGIDEVMSINAFAIDKTFPQLTIYLDLTPEEGLNRIAKNDQREVNRLDLEKLSFHQKVYDGYKILIDRYPDRIKVIDARKAIQEEVDECLNLILEKING